MRRLVVIAAIWVLLFAATLAVSLVSDVAEATADVVGQNSASDAVDEILRQLAQTELAAIPRTTDVGRSGGTTDSDERLDQQLESELHRVILDNKQRFRSCAARTLARQKRPNEYFEISFLLRRVDSAGTVRMDGLVLERTTASFEAEEETCMFDLLRDLRFSANSAPTERIFYQLCFNRPPQPPAG